MTDARAGAWQRALAAAVLLGLTTTPPGAWADEADAKALLKAMSDYLAEQDRLSFDFDATLEVVTDDDQKLALADSGSVTIARPDRLLATRTGGFVDLQVTFDGQTLTLFGKNANVYTQIELPGTIDHLVDELRENYGRPLPAADLIMSDPYEGLMSEVVDVKDLGSGIVGGRECDWLAFRTDDVDWQIWIARSDEPYPCRFVITSKRIDQAPQYTIQVRDWRTGDAVATTDFAFSNDTGAADIDEAAFAEQVSELPAHFSLADGR
ncbi:MAG: DUF2092 domain-containing protein [Pseudomonadota bacterium]